MTRAEVLREIICARTPDGSAHLVLFANRHWLPIYSAYPMARAEMLDGKRVGQVALLEGHGSPSALLKLFRLAARRFSELGLDVVFVAVAPDDVEFYKRLLFQPTGWTCQGWDFADYALVEVMRLDLPEARGKLAGALRRFAEDAH
jgi:hypothetical protein